ncbi:MAG TPA: hypothetical protein VL137_10095, partial [Polyangiaceae bacterium]|nr:hypothetical protein [Polyangiaceae bacterium]
GRIARLARPEYLASGALALAVVLAFPAQDALRTFADLGKIRIPSKNTTDGYKYYRRIRELPAAKLVVFKPRNVGDRHVPNYYLVVDRQPDNAEIDVISLDPGKAAKKDARLVQTFWREHTDATVVFDWPKKCLRGASSPNRTVRSKTRCSLIVPEVKGPEEFNTLLASLGVTLRG